MKTEICMTEDCLATAYEAYSNGETSVIDYHRHLQLAFDASDSRTIVAEKLIPVTLKFEKGEFVFAATCPFCNKVNAVKQEPEICKHFDAEVGGCGSHAIRFKAKIRI